MSATCFWDKYQADQTFENMTRWLKHRAFCHNNCQDLRGAVRLTGACRKCGEDIEIWATPMPFLGQGLCLRHTERGGVGSDNDINRLNR